MLPTAGDPRLVHGESIIGVVHGSGGDRADNGGAAVRLLDPGTVWRSDCICCRVEVVRAKLALYDAHVVVALDVTGCCARQATQHPFVG